MVCFTNNVTITTKVHTAGVPVWLIHDARLVNANINIIKVVLFTPPDDLITGMYHDPVKLFAQPFNIITRGPNNCQCHEAAHQPYSNFKKLPVPKPQVKQMVTRKSSVGRACVDKGKAKMSAKLAPYNTTAPHQNKAVSGHDKWSDIDMPPMNSFFKIVLEEGNKDILHIKPRDKTSTSFSCPELAQFLDISACSGTFKYVDVQQD
ncbi:hypothetical protein BDR06DRAFT_1010946 [Suillus hirtellus]|nr:hypothetical protein BDR06DRAFT_1010946 [Suillus hirtellus]